MDRADITHVLATHGLTASTVRSLKGSFDKDIHLIDHTLVLRPSLTVQDHEFSCFRRIATLALVPQVLHRGQFKDWHYLLLTQLPGTDLIDALGDLTPSQTASHGRAIAAFLDSLHGLRGSAYDIGHYIPLIPSFDGTWRTGHRQYRDWLATGVAGLAIPPAQKALLTTALDWLTDHGSCLDHQTGPVLLHNDFHPRNILTMNGQFSGVIDWECSQFGEPDFELCHLVHWCRYPPRPDLDLRPLLGAVLADGPSCTLVPCLAERLTIYVLEHELIQLVWSGGRGGPDRFPRVADWLDGGVDRLLAAL